MTGGTAATGDAELLPRAAKRTKSSASGNNNDRREEDAAAEEERDDLQAKIVALWSGNGGNGEEQHPDNEDNAFAATVTLLSGQIDKLIKEGINAFHQAESASSELELLKREVEHKNQEIANLRAADEKNTAALSVRTLICALSSNNITTLTNSSPNYFCSHASNFTQNVLRALEQSRATARDIGKKAETEAHLRAEIFDATSKRDEAVMASAEAQRKTELLQEEVRGLKVKLSRATQEKLKLERDSVRFEK